MAWSGTELSSTGFRTMPSSAKWLEYGRPFGWCWIKKIRRLVPFIYCLGTRKNIIVQFYRIKSGQLTWWSEGNAWRAFISSHLFSASPSDRYRMRNIIHRELQLELCALLEPARLSNTHIRVPDVPYHNVDRFVFSFMSNTRIWYYYYKILFS